MSGKKRRLIERSTDPGNPVSAIAASFAIGGSVDPLQLVTYATTPAAVANAAGSKAAAGEAREGEAES